MTEKYFIQELYKAYKWTRCTKISHHIYNYNWHFLSASTHSYSKDIKNCGNNETNRCIYGAMHDHYQKTIQV